MSRKAEKRQSATTNNRPSKTKGLNTQALNSHDFEEFMDQMLASDNETEEGIPATPICHVY